MSEEDPPYIPAVISAPFFKGLTKKVQKALNFVWSYTNLLEFISRRRKRIPLIRGISGHSATGTSQARTQPEPSTILAFSSPQDSPERAPYQTENGKLLNRKINPSPVMTNLEIWIHAYAEITSGQATQILSI